MTNLYSEALLERAASHPPLPDEPSCSATATNPLCGDELTIGVRLEDDRFTAIGFTSEACAICVASASIMCERLHAQPLGQLSSALAALERTLSGERADEPLFAPLRALTEHPSRRSCALLPWRALERALFPAPTATHTPAPKPRTADNIWAAACALQDPGAIATLISVEGSSPCPLGSRMVISSSGDFWGSVSGGCVESAVVQAALRILEDPSGPQVHSYQISNSQAGAVGLPCGGRIQVHIATMPPSAVLKARAQLLTKTPPQPTFAVTNIATGEQQIVHGNGNGADGLPNEVAAALRAQEPLLLEGPSGAWFIEPLLGPHRLVIIGATHIAQKLMRLAAETGFEVLVIDPRSSLANAARFGEARLFVELPQRALPQLIDARTAVVALTHDSKLDDPALKIALPSEAFYVGALGSRKTQRARLQRLEDAGVKAHHLARLDGPAGVAIGAKGPAEIALSILAEVIKTKRLCAQAPRVGAVILAAGSSRRAGPKNKLLQNIEGEVMIRRVIQTALEASLTPCIVVLGHEADQVREALSGLPVQLIQNTRHPEGMGASIAVGVEAMASTDVDAAFVILGDMPYVRAEDLRKLMHARSTSTKHMVIRPVSQAGEIRRPGNPVLWPRDYFSALTQLTGDVGGKKILKTAGDVVLEIEIDHHGVLRDIDHSP